MAASFLSAHSSHSPCSSGSAIIVQESDLEALAARMKLELGNGPVEGRSLVEWLVSNSSHECASFTMHNEVRMCVLALSL